MKAARSYILIGAVGAGMISGVAVAQQAIAEPTGCSHYTQFTVGPEAGKMNSDGHGTCNASAKRDFRAEIKHDLTGRPDPLVGAADVVVTGTTYHAVTRNCDHGNTGTYYVRSFFPSSETNEDTPHYVVHTC